MFLQYLFYKGHCVRGQKKSYNGPALSTENQVLNFTWGPGKNLRGCSKNISKIFSFKGFVVLVGS